MQIIDHQVKHLAEKCRLRPKELGKVVGREAPSSPCGTSLKPHSTSRRAPKECSLDTDILAFGPYGPHQPQEQLQLSSIGIFLS